MWRPEPLTIVPGGERLPTFKLIANGTSFAQVPYHLLVSQGCGLVDPFVLGCIVDVQMF